MIRVPVQPQMLQWAADRSGVPEEALRKRFEKYGQWLTGEIRPTLNQLQDFARATYSPIGYFFLTSPPSITLPIPDLRTRGGHRPAEPSPDLLDTVFLCQQRQEWYANYARSIGAAPPTFVGTLSVRDDVVSAASAIRDTLGFDVSVRRALRSWEEALRQFVQQADDAGVLVMISGVVGSNNSRKLDTEEFRGFALSEPDAPLVFVNGSDTKSAQMFTLAHELAHLWLGQSALSDTTVAQAPPIDVEQWCDRVAAEVLVPLDTFRAEYKPRNPVNIELQRLARVFKVSTLVILRRMHDAGGMQRTHFWELYEAEVSRLIRLMKAKAGGGDYYRTTTTRVSSRFTRAIVASALEGRSTFTEAFRLLGCRKMSTFSELGRHVGVDAAIGGAA
ncbi:MAG: ImmA/IrrE family metallo-endopeptidase [Phycisphaeraceae bacterium]|nr:ImmA/IrrE family metallo-endopeptidase [Phycisphaeraceae bacterium]